VPVPNNPKRLATNLPAAGGDFVPYSPVELHAAFRELAGKSDDLADHEFSHRARVGEGRVEDADAVFRGIFEVDLVGADAEAADDDQVLGVFEDVGRELGFGADADDLHVFDLFDQFVFGEGGREGFELVALCTEDLLAGCVDVLEEEHFYIFGVEGFQLFGRGSLGCLKVLARAVEGGVGGLREAVGVFEGVGDGAVEVVGGAVALRDVAGGGGHGGGDVVEVADSVGLRAFIY